MDEVSAQATLAPEIESPLGVTIPRSEVERVLQADAEADLILDVVRKNGQEETRRVTLAWDREALERLLAQDGEQVVVAIDPVTLQKAFDEVEAHGVREVGATLAVLVATAAGGAGMASAYPAEGATPAGGAEASTFVPFQTDFPTVAATVDTTVQSGAPGAPGATQAADEGSLQTDPGGPPVAARAMPSDYAAQAGIENVRAAQEAPEATPDPMTGIENVRAGGSAVPDTMAGIEQVRAERGTTEASDGGGISAPSPTQGIMIGGALLAIAAAAFVLRRKAAPPEPGVAS